MARAIWRNAVLAESDETRLAEDTVYFPPASLHREYFQPSETHSECPWKGRASYFDIVVEGERNPDAAWYYPEPRAGDLRDYVAFWKGVVVES